MDFVEISIISGNRWHSHLLLTTHKRRATLILSFWWASQIPLNSHELLRCFRTFKLCLLFQNTFPKGCLLLLPGAIQLGLQSVLIWGIKPRIHIETHDTWMIILFHKVHDLLSWSLWLFLLGNFLSLSLFNQLNLLIQLADIQAKFLNDLLSNVCLWDAQHQ